MGLKRTPLYSKHVQAGGRIVDFAGWEMPVQYNSPVEEHNTVRQAAGIFDVSHMGRFTAEGSQVGEALDALVPNNVTGLVDGKMLYTQLCKKDGGILDDLIIGRWDETHYSVVVNACGLESDFEWMKSNMEGKDCQLTDISAQTGMIAAQGKTAISLLDPNTPIDLLEAKPFQQFKTDLFGISVIISTTGYTGEKGVEIIAPNDDIGTIWDRLLEAGFKPIGLGARDSLRLEKGYSLYGNDIDETTTPIEACLGWSVKPNEKPFIGSEVILEQKEKGTERKLVGFKMLGKGIPRHDYPVFDGETQISTAASGGFSPCLGCGIGMAYVPVALAKMGTKLLIGIRKNKIEIEVTRRPFV
jgi:glycine cleavage system T protein (aminomethyltransferase)